MSKVKCSRELRFEIAEEYLNMPSMASISRWLKTSLTQNSEEMIADEAPEPFILICRIETLHHREEPRMAAMWCYGKDIKNRCDFIRHRFCFSRFYALTGSRCFVLLPLNQ